MWRVKAQGGGGTSKIRGLGECNIQAHKSISNSAQYVTPDSKFYVKKVKMWQFSSRNWFSHTKFV
jgi:hypothetical protein